MELTIRPIRREEFPLLADFLYDAIYRSDPSSPLPRQIVEHPSLRIYIADFGTLPDDRCLVAQAEGHVVGMVWCAAFGPTDISAKAFPNSSCRSRLPAGDRASAHG